MNANDKTALIEQSLARAAEQLGDVTPAAMQRFYAAHPEARAAFEHHSPNNRVQLEGEMIERTLYCLMYWFSSPGEIEVLLGGSVPHHSDTLDVMPEWYGGLIDATVAVIVATIPAENESERVVWRELRDELLGLVSQSGQYARKRSRS